jgi:glutaminyl-tRNA synthetase
VIRCEDVVKDAAGRVVEVRCTHDPETWGHGPSDGRKIGGTIHWLSEAHAVPCEVRLYDRLFSVADPEAEAVAKGGEGDFRDFLNPASLHVMDQAYVEPSVVRDDPDTRYQFERLGYFWRDPRTGRGDRLVFNRIVTLRDSWAARAAEEGPPSAQGGFDEVDAAAANASVPQTGQGTHVVGVGAPEAPAPEVRERATALVDLHHLGEVDAEILARDPELVAFFEATVARLVGAEPWGERTAPAVAAANWIINAVPRVQADRPLADLRFGAPELAALITLVEEGTISSSGGQEVLEILSREGGDPRAIVERQDLRQVSDASAIRPIAAEVIAAYPDKAQEFREGKTGLLGFFMGQVMRRTAGKADPELARALLMELLE